MDCGNLLSILVRLSDRGEGVEIFSFRLFIYISIDKMSYIVKYENDYDKKKRKNEQRKKRKRKKERERERETERAREEETRETEAHTRTNVGDVE